ncbi:MAG: Trans-aconitate 2-methyltransferase [Stenotrophomonas maltophilia]|uniref:Trans-aconitate 2-methyltransferase n=1 Tax=Stenotrophomonas maltophilia TaxID=40324 RepID=A0A7V8JLT4_STEMA|nr:MAG: Trans-aconitate 2-methyltransferase [Stenotrophomonas maltophilia]
MTWSATQYSRFEDERTRPVRDLVNAITREQASTAVDLGCGPGNSTDVLAARYPQAVVSGLDSSDDMIRSARARLPQLQFEVADIGQWRASTPVDVILANASLQWLPDHATLYPHLLAQLSEGGCLAVQTPDNLEEPAHRVAREVAASGPWRAAIGHVVHPDRHPAAWYYALLKPHCRRLDIWRTTYLHPLAGGIDAIVEWFKGSALRPYLGALDGSQQASFLAEYRQGIARAYTLLDDGTALLPFPRLFIVATR